MKNRFITAYIILGMSFGILLSSLIFSSNKPIINKTNLPKISNSSPPYIIEKHFSGKPAASGPASSLGMKDGTCWQYTNKSSWQAIYCYGGYRP